MQAMKVNRSVTASDPTPKYIYIAIIFVTLLVVAVYGYNAYRALQPTALPQGAIRISQSTLEEKYGLRVNLVAVTAAGGFVDLRLKIVDGDKARLLLADEKNFPVLFSEHGIILNAPEDTKSQKIEFITGGNLFILYPNPNNTIQRDGSVNILFGDIALESMVVK